MASRYELNHGIRLRIYPTRSNRKTPRSYDETIYKERNLIKRLFNRLKNIRRLAARFEKSTSNYKAVVTIACIHCS